MVRPLHLAQIQVQSHLPRQVLFLLDVQQAHQAVHQQQILLKHPAVNLQGYRPLIHRMNPLPVHLAHQVIHPVCDHHLVRRFHQAHLQVLYQLCRLLSLLVLYHQQPLALHLRMCQLYYQHRLRV